MQKNVSKGAKIDQFTLVFQMDKTALDHYDDYLNFVESIISQLEYELKLDLFEKSESSTNIKGYTETYDYGGTGIRIAYHKELPNQGIILYVTAGGWYHYRNQSGLNLSQILNRCKNIKNISEYHLTRLDFAVDIYDKRASIDRLSRSIKRGTTIVCDGRNVANNRVIKTYAENDVIQTMYIGSRQSELHFRCYDKKAEQLASKKPMYLDFARHTDYWFRYEAEMKYELARQLGRDIEPLGNDDEINQYLASVVRSRINFKMTKTGKLHFVSDVIADVANGVKFESVVRRVDRNQSLIKSKERIYDDNAGFISTLYKIKKVEGNVGLVMFLADIFLYVCAGYQPTKSVRDWLDNAGFNDDYKSEPELHPKKYKKENKIKIKKTKEILRKMFEILK